MTWENVCMGKKGAVSGGGREKKKGQWDEHGKMAGQECASQTLRVEVRRKGGGGKNLSAKSVETERKLPGMGRRGGGGGGGGG